MDVYLTSHAVNTHLTRINHVTLYFSLHMHQSFNQNVDLCATTDDVALCVSLHMNQSRHTFTQHLWQTPTTQQTPRPHVVSLIYYKCMCTYFSTYTYLNPPPPPPASFPSNTPTVNGSTLVGGRGWCVSAPACFYYTPSSISGVNTFMYMYIYALM